MTRSARARSRVRADRPASASPATDVENRIGELVAELVEDGASIEFPGCDCTNDTGLIRQNLIDDN
jgi:hypothetical protein